MRPYIFAAFSVLWCASMLFPVTARAIPSAGEWSFQVLLDGKPIGVHRFEVSRHGNEFTLLSEAEFKVDVLAIPLYRYRHISHESFEGDCLQQLNASTDDNGTHRAVLGSAGDAGFTVTTQEGTALLPSCVMTFDYWNPHILQQSHLLNPQTGAYQPVHVTHVGPEVLKVGDSSEVAEAYLLAAEGMQIKIWYSEDTRWLGLESTLSDGRRMRYQLR